MSKWFWFAFPAKQQGELRRQGFEVFAPSARGIVLFPGYVFCRAARGKRMVTDEEMAGIRMIEASGLPAQPWPYLRTGQRAQVERGSLAGLEGMLIRERDALRVVVSVEGLRRAVAVEISHDLICAVQGALHASEARVYLTQIAGQ